MAVWAAAGGLMLALGSVGGGEQGTGVAAGAQAQQIVPPSVVPPEPRDERTISMEEEQAKLRNIDRQKRLVEDTTKLLALANELKAAVDKSNKDTLSLDVVRKADEIEKLAHSVKERMKGE
jgi:type VI protein secretion system component VasF